MATKPIVWSTRASKELQEILDYFIKRNGSAVYSLKSLDEIEATLSILSKNEWIGKPATDKKLRVLFMKNYSFIYEIEEEQIKLHSFWDNRQNPEKSLK